MSRRKKRLSLPLLEEMEFLDESLFNEQFDWKSPEYLESNMKHKLRYYQDTALRYFHYSQTNEVFNFRNINHVLFNMATGSGKTDLMAGIILYLYKEHNFRNFLFLVNTNGVLNKTIDNLTNTLSTKYLYKPNLEINGSRIDIKQVESFPKNQNKNTIYLKLATVQRVAADIYTERENSMGELDYSMDKVVILGDEAHHYSASTKSEKEDEKSWEKAISTILEANKNNLLLEFTATIDLENKNIYEKYKDKILYRYELNKFIQDKFSKNVKRIQSSNTDIENMMNVILLSEYRRRYAFENHGISIKPVIMFKSQRIDASNNAHEMFNTLVNNLTVESLKEFLERQLVITTEEDSETLAIAHNYYRTHNSLGTVIRDIKREMSPNRVINANDTSQSGILEKGHYKALNTLENVSNLYRVIFAVARLTEGWDVLNLFDIIRLSDDPKVNGTRATTMSEAQLIGRGARYYPFKLNGEESFRRRFNDDEHDSLILETIHYHTINEPQYLKNLIKSLDEMDLPTGEDKLNPALEVKIKPSFKKTKIWKHGKIYYNETIEVPDSYYSSLDKYGINTKDDVKIPYISSLKEVGYKDSEIYEDYSTSYDVALNFDKRFLNKVTSRLSFYHFDNLKKYIPLLKSKEDFFSEQWLNLYNRTIYVSIPQAMKVNLITSNEKLHILEVFLIDISKEIISGFNKARGTGKFIGFPIKDYIIDYRKRIPKFDTGRFIRSQPQNIQLYNLKEDYFVYDSAIINITEKQLIDRISERVEELKKVYSDVYLIRMDENMHRESVKNNNLKLHQFGIDNEQINLSGFQPDFILYLQNEEFLIQIFIEPKGRNLEEEQWKEDLLTYINENEAEIVFEDNLENIKIKGVKFYTMNDGRGSIKQLGEIALGHQFRGLNFE